MFKEIFLFELRYRSKRPATYLYFLILFLYFFITALKGWVPGSEKAYINSSFIIYQMVALTTILATMLCSAIMGVPVFRDIEHNTRSYLMSYPIGEKSYLLGRYAGSFLVLCLVISGAALGLFIGSALGPYYGSEDPSRYGPANLAAYGSAMLLFMLPNLFFTGTLFFSLVALTKKIFVAYTGSVLFFIAYLLANALTTDIEQRDLAAILDPYALNALDHASRYWTPAEQNTILVPFSGNLMWNRILWLGVATAIFAFTIYKFNFQAFLAEKANKKKAVREENNIIPSSIKIPDYKPVFSVNVHFRQMIKLAGLEFSNIVKDVYFLGIMLGGILFLFLDGWFGFPQFGTPSLPTTYYMLEVKEFNYIVFVYIILIFYSGEVVHRDKSVGYNQIADVLPIPNWVVYGSKFLAIVFISFLLVNLPLLTGVLNQVLKGYYDFQLAMYFQGLYLIEFPEYLQLAMLTFFIHIMVNNKFPGHALSIGVWVLMFSLRNFAEKDFNMFFYSYTPGYTISDMNGFGHFMEALNWFNIYWLALGCLLLTIGTLFWTRSSENNYKSRLKIASQRRSFGTVTVLSFMAIIWIGSGGFIFYNTAILNKHINADDYRNVQADFEKKYAYLLTIPQPKITDIKLTADIYPEDRRLSAKAVSIITNKWKTPIDTLYLNASQRLKYFKINGQSLEPFFIEDMLVAEGGGEVATGLKGFLWYKLPQSMNPGDTLTMETLTEISYQGFPNSGSGREVVYNGTFFSGGIPSFGYDPGVELSSDKERKKRHLEEKDYSLPPQDDEWGLSNLLFNDDADYVTYEAIVSTAPDQIAISPGYLQKEWEENGRKYYHYKMEGEMDMFFNVVSARYDVTKDVWKGADGSEINIEIFHHPTHTRNVDRFILAVKKSFDYFNTNFTPYQYRQMRILEFPRYAGFAQSFPNTVPYSESFGWVGDFSDPDKTDYAFYVTSHEVAHQWWGHQVTPSATRGANQLSETMAEYSALMVQKKEFGEDAMQKFLKYSLDSYLRGRFQERKFEETLMENDSRPYVWYQKGSLVMYALQDYIGEDKVNKALKKFLEKAAFREKAPFVTTNEFYPYLDEVVPDSLKYFLEDSWKKISLYENRINNATIEKTGEDEYKVKLEVFSKKTYYDGLGNEKEEGGQDEYIELGIFAEDVKNDKGMTIKKPLYLKKHWLKPGEHTIEIMVKGKPVKAGIDPYNKLIDRIPDDNVKKVDEI